MLTRLCRKRDGGDGPVHVLLPDILEQKEQVGMKNTRDLGVPVPVQRRNAQAQTQKQAVVRKACLGQT